MTRIFDCYQITDKQVLIKCKNEYLKGLSILVEFDGVASSKDWATCIAGLLNRTEKAEHDEEGLGDYIKDVKYVDLRK
jgi:hypothetical protein